MAAVVVSTGYIYAISKGLADGRQSCVAHLGHVRVI